MIPDLHTIFSVFSVSQIIKKLREDKNIRKNTMQEKPIFPVEGGDSEKAQTTNKSSLPDHSFHTGTNRNNVFHDIS